MHAVIVEVDLSGTDRQTAITRLKEEIIPRVRERPGFVSGTWLAPGEQNMGFGLVVFDSEEHAASMQSEVQPGSHPQPGSTVKRSEIRQVTMAVERATAAAGAH